MTNLTRRKVRWDSERLRAYVIRAGVRFWSPQETVFAKGVDVSVNNPTKASATVRCHGLRETWVADATPPPPER